MDGRKKLFIYGFILTNVLFFFSGCAKEETNTFSNINDLISAIESDSPQNENTLAKIDSLFILSENNNYSVGKATAFYLLGNYYYSQKDYEKSMSFCDSSIKISLASNEFPLLIKNYDRLAKIYNRLNNRDSSVSYFIKTAEISKIINDSTEIGKAYNNAGYIYWQGNQYDSAIVYFEKALEIREKLNNTDHLSSTLNNIGTVYYQWQIFDRALEYYFKSLEVKRKTGGYQNISQVLTNIGIVYKETNEINRALEYYNESLNYAKLEKNAEAIGYVYNSLGSAYIRINTDSSSFYFEKALETYKNLNYSGGIIISLKGIGENYIEFSKYDEAKKIFNQILEIAETNNYPLRIAEANIYLGNINLAQNNINEAKNNFKIAIKISEKQNLKNFLRDAYKQIAEAYERSGEYLLAYKYFSEFDKIRDQITNEETERNINELKSRFEFEKFLRTIESEQFKAKQQQDYLIAAFIFIIFGAVLLLIVIRSNYKRGKLNEMLQHHNKLIEKQSSELKGVNEELKALNLSKDKLFSIIAHDLRNPFFALINYSTFLKEDYSTLTEEEKTEYIENIYRTTASTYELLENLLNLSASRTGKISFKQENIKVKQIFDKIIDLYENSIKSKNLIINNSIVDEDTIFSDYKMSEIIFRNIINNAIKYSNKNGIIDISLSTQNENVVVVIKDNGIGMDEETKKNLFNEINIISQNGTSGEKGTGLGLSLSKEFIDKIGGTISVESSPDKGTSFYIFFPENKFVYN